MAKTRYFHAHETARYDAVDGLQLASFTRRACALLIDVAIILLFSLFFGDFKKHAKEMVDSPGWEHLLGELVHEIESLVESVLYFAVALKLGKGQTIGKRLLKIRVYSLTHDQVGWWQSIERGLAYGASLLEGGFGFFQYFINRNRQTVHDRIAETIVVDVSDSAHRFVRLPRPHLEHHHAGSPDALPAPPPPMP